MHLLYSKNSKQTVRCARNRYLYLKFIILNLIDIYLTLIVGYNNYCLFNKTFKLTKYALEFVLTIHSNTLQNVRYIAL